MLMFLKALILMKRIINYLDQWIMKEIMIKKIELCYNIYIHKIILFLKIYKYSL